MSELEGYEYFDGLSVELNFRDELLEIEMEQSVDYLTVAGTRALIAHLQAALARLESGGNG